ncbi:MAG TPA: hypothetical protein VHT24_14415 [Pseudacidobacterium sp.]|jgi:hypothetical protein|nr:hypothetical protein [Pseudacidobacterium sp.]
MAENFSRREILKGTAATGAIGLAATHLGASTVNTLLAHADESAATRILSLTSNDGVYIPPRGESHFKFSYDFPEPSVEFAGFQFGFRVFTFENTYGLDVSRMRVRPVADGIEIECSQFVWAGGQQKAPGHLKAVIRKNGDVLEWQASAEMDKPIKSIATILRGVPRGKVSVSAEQFFDPKDDELLFQYPYLGGGMTTPLVIIQKSEQQYFMLSAEEEQVRGVRLYLQPGDAGYRTELIYEKGGWERSNTIRSATWRAGYAASVEKAARPHYAHLEKAFGVSDWETRTDIPAWMRETDLVLALHGMHWTGYIFNDFAKMLEILKWTNTRIPGKNVLVFLPAWDGRYYWNYPAYQADPRLGGEDGLRRLVDEGHAMGFRFMPMFGTNSANKTLPDFHNFADAATDYIDGNAYDLDWVDWDNDRGLEGWSPFMNTGVASWRNWLSARISEVIEKYNVDAYFLDIVGGWQNNTKADSFEGTRMLVTELRKKHPNVVAVGEMHYDALMSCIPMYQVNSASLYHPGFRKYVRCFEHLSRPAPGRGSTGVHEAGFQHFRLRPDPNQFTIPTITVVDDTFEKYRDQMAEVIRGAKVRANIS